VRIVRPVAAGQTVLWDDVACNAEDETVKFRREMEAAFKEK